MTWEQINPVLGVILLVEEERTAVGTSLSAKIVPKLLKLNGGLARNPAVFLDRDVSVRDV